MKNKFKVEGDMVTMAVQDKQVIFDLADFPAVSAFGQWKLWKGTSVYTDYRNLGKMCKTTLHKLLTGSKFVRWLNGNTFDFRRMNLAPAETGTRNRPIGSGLAGNKYAIKQGVVYMQTNSTSPTTFLFDEEDLEIVKGLTWHVNVKHGYVQSSKGRRDGLERYLLHRLIMDVKDSSIYVDHISGNKLDNRKCNLRLCSNSENLHNTYKHRDKSVGVSMTADGYWTAQIQIDGVRHRKVFKAFDDAAEQFRKWEAEFNPTGLAEK
jgi:hypothetical protein